MYCYFIREVVEKRFHLRKVFELWERGLSEAESASMLKIPLNTVKSRRNKIRRVVRERLGVSLTPKSGSEPAIQQRVIGSRENGKPNDSVSKIKNRIFLTINFQFDIMFLMTNVFVMWHRYYNTPIPRIAMSL